MKRILLVVSVAALMVAMLVATAMPAFAAPPDRTDDKQCKGGNPNCVTANPGGQPKGASQTDQFKPGR